MRAILALTAVILGVSLGFQPGGVECLSNAEYTEEITISQINSPSFKSIHVLYKALLTCGEGDTFHCKMCVVTRIIRKQVGSDDWTDDGGFLDEDTWTVTCGLSQLVDYDEIFYPVEANYVYRIEGGVRNVPCNESGGILIAYDDEEITIQ